MKKLFHFTFALCLVGTVAVSAVSACEPYSQKAVVAVKVSEPIENAAVNPSTLPEENSVQNVSKAEDNANTKANDPPATFTLNKTGQLPEYADGETVIITATVKRTGYPYLFDVDCQGNATCLYPNKYVPKGVETKLNANDKFIVPDENADFQLKVQAPFGKERIYLVLTDGPIDPSLVGAESFLKASATPVDSVKLKQVIPTLKKKAFVTSVEIKTVPAGSNVNSEEDNENSPQVSYRSDRRVRLSSPLIKSALDYGLRMVNR